MKFFSKRKRPVAPVPEPTPDPCIVEEFAKEWGRRDGRVESFNFYYFMEAVSKGSERCIEFLGKLLEKFGIVLPISISRTEKTTPYRSYFNHSVITGDGKTVLLKVCPEKYLLVEEETRDFHIGHDGNEFVQSLIRIKMPEIELTSSYSVRSFPHWTVVLNDSYHICIKITEFHNYAGKDVLLSCRPNIEEYLLTLQWPCTAKEIYTSLRRILDDFGADYLDYITDTNITIAKVISHDENGQPESFQDMSELNLEQGEVAFHTYGANCSYDENGNWSYEDDFLKFCASSNTVSVSFDADRDDIANGDIDLAAMLKEAEEHINALKKENGDL